jgi:hypothetical protein
MVQRSCSVLAFLALFSVAHAATCPSIFANMTTCKILNGLPALGSGSQITTLGVSGFRNLDILGNTTITLNLPVTKNTIECKAKLIEFSCIYATAGSLTADATGAMLPTYATTCNDDGTQMKPCYAWCIEFYSTCALPPYSTYPDSICKDNTATTKCYGNDGVKGMKPGSATGSAAMARPYPPSVVLPLAVAVVGLGTVLSGNAPA